MKNKMKWVPSLLIAGLLSLTAITTAKALDAPEYRMLADTKINLIQAIQAAEKNLGGTAVEAGLDDDSFKPAYEVSVVKDGRVFDVQVDGVSGEVVGSREDNDD